MKSAVDQVTNSSENQSAMFQTWIRVKAGVDLSPFDRVSRHKDLAAYFDDISAMLIKLVFQEASAR